jgi:hypothetical protein
MSDPATQNRRRAVRQTTAALREYTDQITRLHRLGCGVYWTLGTLLGLCPCRATSPDAPCDLCRPALAATAAFHQTMLQLGLRTDEMDASRRAAELGPAAGPEPAL